MKFFLITILIMSGVLTHTGNATEQPIARVFDQKIMHSDLQNHDGRALSLTEIIIPKLLDKYKKKNNLSFDPTAEEIDAFKVWFSKQNPNQQQETEQEEQQTILRLKEMAEKEGWTDEETKQRISQYRSYLENQPPMGERMAHFVLPQWKTQVYFYKNYGGGRVLWQQGGTEAYDAFHNWLLEQEKAGNFEIYSQEEKENFYQYWNRQSSFLLDDKQVINEKFLNPEWAH